MESAGLRLAVLFAALFLSGGVAVAGVLWWASAGALDRQLDEAIRLDARTLAERHRAGGREGLLAALAERLADDYEADLYALRDASGRVLAGNVEPWPEAMEGPAAAQPRPAPAGARSARMLRLDLPGGDELLVGRDAAPLARLREVLTRGLVWGASAAGVLALLGAWLLRRILESRLRPAAETAAAIAEGDLSLRVPLTGRGDEFDRLAALLNAMLDRVDGLMAGIRGVSDAVAHDLRTPLARLRARLEAGARGDGAALRAAVEAGIADLDGVMRVFQALLRIAEAESGARRAAFAPLDLAPLLADAAELYAPAVEARGGALETALPLALPLVGDRDLLLQAVANLLDNAAKFSPEGGVVRIAARALPEAVRVEVSDEGPGLSPTERARAGERFYRADAARATPGTGLGLSLVRAVAALHGGRLVLEPARPGAERPGLSAALLLPAGAGGLSR